MLRTVLASLRARVAGTLLGGTVATLIDGTLAGGSAVSLLYAGSTRYAREFELLLSRAAREAAGDILYEGSALGYLAVRDALRQRAETADLVVRQAMLGGRRGGDFAHVPFLRAHLRLERTLEEQIQGVRSKAHRRRMRSVVRSREYEWTVSTRESDFALFYERMYAPYVERKFGRAAHIESRAAVTGLLERAGRTLLVRYRGEAVCGSLLLHPRFGGKVVYHLSGFVGGERLPSTILAMRTAALEVAVLDYSLREGFRTLDLGITRAVMNDGLFVHKRRLGASFVPSPDAPTFFVRMRPDAGPRVLASLPMVAIERGGFVAHVGYERGAPPQTVRGWRRVVKNYSFPRLRRAILHTDALDGDPGRGSFEAALRLALREVPLELAVVSGTPSRNVQ